MEGLQEATNLLVCLAREMLALAKFTCFPDRPLHPSPGSWARGTELQPVATCGVWQEESDNEVTEPPLVLGTSSFQLLKNFGFMGSGAFFDHQGSVLS